MKPIRGPIDYNRYPPRDRRASTDAPPSASASSSSPRQTPPRQTPPRQTPPRQTPQAHASPRRHATQTGRPRMDEAQANDFPRDEEAFGEEAFGEEAFDANARHHETIQETALEVRRRRRVRSRYKRVRHAPDQARDVAAPRRVRSGKRRVALWKRARRWSGLLLLALLVELGVAATTSSHFAIKQVEVQGLNVTSPEQVAPARDALLGKNWLRAPLGHTQRELETLPTVKRAELTRMLSWPPQILIRVVERQPFARIGAGGNWFVVDQDGVPFRAVTTSQADRALYAVTGSALEPQLGRALPAASWRPVRDVATALRNDEKEGGRWALRRIYFDRHGFASLRLTGGAHDEMLVQLGADRWPEKLRRARQSLAYFEATGRRAATLNLLSYSMPTWTPRPVSQAVPKAVSQALPNQAKDDQRAATPSPNAARTFSRVTRNEPENAISRQTDSNQAAPLPLQHATRIPSGAPPA